MYPSSKHTRAFTFIELLVTMAMIAILASLAYPTFISIMERARKTQAKNDLTQIVTAVNAYYTEYGKYPLATDDNTISNNADLFYSLRAIAGGANAGDVQNPRKIVFIQPPDSKVSNPAKAGIDPATTSPTFGAWFDPWGLQYRIAIDGTYDNQITNPYNPDTGAGTSPLNIGVISWSAGKDGKAPDNGGTQTFSDSDDMLSWK